MILGLRRHTFDEYGRDHRETYGCSSKDELRPVRRRADEHHVEHDEDDGGVRVSVPPSELRRRALQAVAERARQRPPIDTSVDIGAVPLPPPSAQGGAGMSIGASTTDSVTSRDTGEELDHLRTASEKALTMARCTPSAGKIRRERFKTPVGLG